MAVRQSEAIKVTVLGMFINLLLTIFKFLAGILGNSSAMIADAVHSTSDFASDFVVIFSFKMSRRPPDEDHDYGHGKFETLAALVVSVMLIFVGLGIAWNGSGNLFRFFNGEILVKPGLIALAAAAISIIMKEFLYRVTLSVGKKIESEAIIANAWHHRSDALSSVSTLIGIGGAILLGEKWRVLDPIAAILVSVFIVKTGIDILRKAMKEFLEASLGNETKNKIISITRGIRGVKNPHSLKTRKIGNTIAIDLHVDINPELKLKEAHEIADEIEEKLKIEFGNDTMVYVHMEPESE